MVQTALNSGFSLFTTESIVDAASIHLLDYLNANTTYYWRVTPFNEYRTCINWSESRSFTTGSGISSVASIEGVNDFVVSPNPVSAGAELTFSIDTQKSFTADFDLISVEGKSVFSRTGLDFSAGNSSISVPTEKLSAGLYFASIRTANGVINKRVVITE